MAIYRSLRDEKIIIRGVGKGHGDRYRPELLPHVFDIFVQAASQESERAGLGLGLTLVRSLVEFHGGNVEARSDGLGHGSEFLVRIPIAAIDPENDKQEQEVTTNGSIHLGKTAAYSSRR